MQIGDKVTFTPDAWANVKQNDKGRYQIPVRVTGRVIYIHPQRRFFTAEYVVSGYRMVETLYFKK